MARAARSERSDVPGDDANRPLCGIVRPIADVPGYPDGHWEEVEEIITGAAKDAGHNARLVSNDEALGVILGRIVANLHSDPIVVVDVSSLNPNVMFELGLRLAFDKPVVVIKDTITRYPFDTSPLEYLEYPADLRHAPLMKFRAKLVEGIKSTVEAASGKGYRSFLKHFGPYKPGELGEGEALTAGLIMDELAGLKALVSRSASATNARPPLPPAGSSGIQVHRRLRFKLLAGEDSVSAAIVGIESIAWVTSASFTVTQAGPRVIVAIDNGDPPIPEASSKIIEVAAHFGVKLVRAIYG